MKTQKQIIEEVLKELFDKSFLDKVRRNDAEDLICFSDLEEAMQKFSKLQREDELKFLKDFRKKADTTHSCKHKKCNCYFHNMEDQNCYVIYKEDIKRSE